MYVGQARTLQRLEITLAPAMGARFASSVRMWSMTRESYRRRGRPRLARWWYFCD